MISMLEVWENKFRILMQKYFETYNVSYIKKAALCYQAKKNVCRHLTNDKA